jgi:hypothetical protein
VVVVGDRAVVEDELVGQLGLQLAGRAVRLQAVAGQGVGVHGGALSHPLQAEAQANGQPAVGVEPQRAEAAAVEPERRPQPLDPVIVGDIL